jgi:hypothetical protein
VGSELEEDEVLGVSWKSSLEFEYGETSEGVDEVPCKAASST